MKEYFYFVPALVLGATVFILSGCSENNNPKNRFQRSGQRPNVENFQNDCEVKNENDSCNLEIDEKSITGTCQKRPNNDTLMCQPSNIPERPQMKNN